MPQFSLTQVIPDIQTVNVVDIGAMSLDAGDEPYAPLLRLDKAKVIGFEPDKSAFADLQAKPVRNQKWFNFSQARQPGGSRGHCNDQGHIRGAARRVPGRS